MKPLKNSSQLPKGKTMTAKIEIMKQQADVLHVENAYFQAKATLDEMVQEYELELEKAFVPSSDFTTVGVEVVGTSGQGSVTATREQVMKTFGAPAYCEWDSFDKITIEWEVLFNDGTIATIYDWKRNYDGDLEDPIGLFEEFTWNIGGNNENAVKMVEEAIAKANN